jgi:predicted nicotinamide N-methyase
MRDAADPPPEGANGRDGKPRPPRGLAPGIPLEWREFALGGGRLGCFAPVDPDALLDALTQEEFDRADQRMPYWAVLWPSAMALADLVLRGPSLRGRAALDLGCGLGVVGLAALSRGATTTFLDWDPTAVAVARASVEASSAGGGEFVVADWRSPPASLGRFDVVLAADVLYEERNAPGVAAFLAAHSEPGGETIVVDPGRRHAAAFPEHLARVGLASSPPEKVVDPVSTKECVALRIRRA